MNNPFAADGVAYEPLRSLIDARAAVGSDREAISRVGRTRTPQRVTVDECGQHIDQGTKKRPQARQDQPLVMSGPAHHRVQRVAKLALGPVSWEQAVGLHVADHGLDDLSPLEQCFNAGDNFLVWLRIGRVAGFCGKARLCGGGFPRGRGGRTDTGQATPTPTSESAMDNSFAADGVAYEPLRSRSDARTAVGSDREAISGQSQTRAPQCVAVDEFGQRREQGAIKRPQARQDQPQVMIDPAYHRMQRVAQLALEPVPGQQAACLHVVDTGSTTRRRLSSRFNAGNVAPSYARQRTAGPSPCQCGPSLARGISKLASTPRQTEFAAPMPGYE